MAESEELSLQERNELLKSELDRERKKNYAYVEEIRMLKEQSVEVQSILELEEEAITNKLIKRLSMLKDEKQAIANEVEQEEEFLTNTLQKRLQTVQREKVELERQLEDEKEYIVNKLQKQLDELARARCKLNKEKVDLENQLETEQEYIMNKLQKQVDSLAHEKVDLMRERELMRKHVQDLKAEKDRINLEKANLENQLEAEEEQIVNRLQKQIEEIAWQYMLLERKYEATLSGSTPRTSESEASEDEHGLVPQRDVREQRAPPGQAELALAHKESATQRRAASRPEVSIHSRASVVLARLHRKPHKLTQCAPSAACSGLARPWGFAAEHH